MSEPVTSGSLYEEAVSANLPLAGLRQADDGSVLRGDLLTGGSRVYMTPASLADVECAVMDALADDAGSHGLHFSLERSYRIADAPSDAAQAEAWWVSYGGRALPSGPTRADALMAACKAIAESAIASPPYSNEAPALSKASSAASPSSSS